ncbi:MAG TPA: sigma-70 family RNA polymerase sigma factor [Candidatus Acidoferrales bacterium]|jgi:RNA polymerase sigma-70 factor (ECF subfamily)|nr:sigma-70 family RNA polymerase sigma factor [Candidatus Acidoferrales bacterium]
MNEFPKTSEVPSDEDLALIRLALAGDRQAFETLVRRHEKRVFRVTLAVLGNVEDAEDAMQETFIKTYRNLGHFRGDSKFTTWLTRIAVNESIQKRQSRRSSVPLEESTEVECKSIPGRFEPWLTNPEKLYGKQEVRRLVEEAIRALPLIYRETLVLRDIEEMSAEEAAEALGIKVPALKSRLLRARLLLRESLAATFEQRPTLGRKVLHAATDFGTGMAMRMMRMAGK